MNRRTEKKQIWLDDKKLAWKEAWHQVWRNEKKLIWVPSKVSFHDTIVCRSNEFNNFHSQKLDWVSAWQQIWKKDHKVVYVPDKKLEWKEGTV